MKNILLIILTFCTCTIYSQPPPPNGGGPSCWPPSAECNPGSAVPINNELVILIVLSLAIVTWHQYKHNAGNPIT